MRGPVVTLFLREDRRGVVRELNIREIGRQLIVRTVLEGSVGKAGDRLRITAQPINVADGYHRHGTGPADAPSRDYLLPAFFTLTGLYPWMADVRNTPRFQALRAKVKVVWERPSLSAGHRHRRGGCHSVRMSGGGARAGIEAL